METQKQINLVAPILAPDGSLCFLKLKYKTLIDIQADLLMRNIDIHESVKLGNNVTIHNGVTIAEGVSVGANTLIRKGVTIKENIKIGNYVEIDEGVTIRANGLIGDNVWVTAKMFAAH